MPDDSTGPVQFQPFNPERADAAFAEYARNDALSCKECRGSGMTTVMRYTSACLACKGTGRIPSADPGQAHYEGCERTAGHHGCAVAKLDAAEARAAEGDDHLALRYLLWIRHGCPFAALYGDDGEMQCNACRIDFKRTPALDITRRFMEMGAAAARAQP